MPARRRGDEIHREFRTRPGSGYIASGFAMGSVLDLVERRRPRSILEVGAGIGAFTAAILEGRDRAGVESTHVAVEDVPFCLGHLRTNLAGQLDRLVVVDHCRDAPADLAPYDLVVIDGGAVTDLLPELQHTWTPDDERAEVAAWMDRLAPGALVVVENERGRQRGFVESEAGARGRSFVHEHVRPLDGSPGFHVYWFDASPRTRLSAAARDVARSVWFPRGVRLTRRIYLKRHGHPKPTRDTVARADSVGGTPNKPLDPPPST